MGRSGSLTIIVGHCLGKVLGQVSIHDLVLGLQVPNLEVLLLDLGKGSLASNKGLLFSLMCILKGLLGIPNERKSPISQ
jgi:hypothetical protein